MNKKPKIDWQLFFVAAIFVAIVAFALFSAFPSLKKLAHWLPDTSQDLAGWVQAFGSIAAIIVTAVIARSDGMHRQDQINKLEAREKRQAKFDLQKTSVLLGMRAFAIKLEAFNRIYTLKKIPPHVNEFKQLYFLVYTKDSFLKLLGPIVSLDDEMRERILTGVAADDFVRLSDALVYFQNSYEELEDIDRTLPEGYLRLNLWRKFSENELEEFQNINEILYDAGMRVMVETKDFLEIVRDLNKSIGNVV